MKVKFSTQNGKEIKLLQDDDESPKFCPLKAPVATQNQLGSVSFIEFPCTSTCVCFHLDFVESPSDVLFCCSATQTCIEVDLIVEKKEDILSIITDL
jgi:hypothetical protein